MKPSVMEQWKLVKHNLIWQKRFLKRFDVGKLVLLSQAEFDIEEHLAKSFLVDFQDGNEVLK